MSDETRDQADQPPQDAQLRDASPRALAPAQPTYEDALSLLTEQQKDFVRYYVRHPVASKAARMAGYETAASGYAGWDLLNNPRVALAIDLGRLQAARAIRFDTVEWLLRCKARASASLLDFEEVDGEVRPKPGREESEYALRKVKRRTTRNRDGSTETTLEYELHPPEPYDRLLASYAGLLQGDAAPVDDAPPAPSVKGVEVRDVVGD